MIIPCVVFIFIVFYVESSLGRGGSFIQETLSDTEYGHETRFCLWKDIRFLPDTDFRDYDFCVHCKCTKNYLSCNSLLETVLITNTLNDGTECEPVQIACHVAWVLKSDKSTFCPEHKIPEHQAVI